VKIVKKIYEIIDTVAALFGLSITIKDLRIIFSVSKIVKSPDKEALQLLVGLLKVNG